MWFLFLTGLILSPCKATPLFDVDDLSSNREFSECQSSELISCVKVHVDFGALLKAESLSFPDGLILNRIHNVEAGTEDAQGFYFKSNGADATFVYHENDGSPLMTGTLNWAEKGRHFNLQPCAAENDCFLWAEVDANHWRELQYKEEGPLMSGEEFQPSDEHERLEAQGRADNTTMATVTITVYTTVEFRSSFSNSQTAIASFINQAITETNAGYKNSGVPITLKLRCIQDSTLHDNSSLSVVLSQFTSSASNNYASLRKNGDITMIMTNGGDYCGIAYLNVISNGRTLGVVRKSCATGYYSFGHEIAHMYGCYHNREVSSNNPVDPTAYGFLMRPPVNSGYRTIMAYPNSNYNTRINFYSNPNVRYNNIPTGDATNNNAQLLIKRRFLMAAVGDENGVCGNEAEGTWSAWSSYSSCSTTCGRGLKVRSRTCLSQSGTATCSGHFEEVAYCNEDIKCSQTNTVALVAGGNGRSYVEVFNPLGGCSHYLGRTPHSNLKPTMGFIKGDLVSCSFWVDKRCFKYNPATSSWSLFATLSTNKTYLSSPSLIHNDQVFVPTEGAIFDGKTLQWKTWNKPPYNLYGGSCMVGLKDSLIVFGTSRYLKYDFNTNSWSSLAQPPYSVYSPSCLLLDNNEILVLGYMNRNYNTTMSYNIETNKWRVPSSTNYNQGAAGLVKLGNRIFVAGGMTQYSEEFNMDTGRWTALQTAMKYNHNSYSSAIAVPADWFKSQSGGCTGVN